MQIKKSDVENKRLYGDFLYADTLQIIRLSELMDIIFIMTMSTIYSIEKNNPLKLITSFKWHYAWTWPITPPAISVCSADSVSTGSCWSLLSENMENNKS